LLEREMAVEAGQREQALDVLAALDQRHVVAVVAGAEVPADEQRDARRVHELELAQVDHDPPAAVRERAFEPALGPRSRRHVGPTRERDGGDAAGGLDGALEQGWTQEGDSCGEWPESVPRPAGARASPSRRPARRPLPGEAAACVAIRIPLAILGAVPPAK